jgi:hypothetical protein
MKKRCLKGSFSHYAPTLEKTYASNHLTAFQQREYNNKRLGCFFSCLRNSIRQIEDNYRVERTMSSLKVKGKHKQQRKTSLKQPIPLSKTP